MSTMFATVAEAGDLAAQAALLLGLAPSLWTDASTITQEAALQLATSAIKSAPYRWYGNESEDCLKLGTVVQALAVIDRQTNGENYARMQRQGIAEVAQGRQRVVFRGAQGTQRSSSMSLCQETREILRPLSVGVVNLQ